MKVRAHAKINLALDVKRRREDGYHELEMIMAPIYLHDLVFVDIINQGIEISSNNRIVPCDERNIVYKVADLLMKEYNIQKGVKIHIMKHIPMQAGLAGGSADGAAVLRAMNQLFHLNLSPEKMVELGNQVGSDIPFCLFEQFAFVSGTGEKLDTFKANPKLQILLVKPKRGVSTKLAYGNLEIDKADHPNCDALRTALIENDYPQIMANLGNSLEQSAIPLVSEIQDIKDALTELGFDGVLMSGSGSCCFGLTTSQEILNKGYQALKPKYPFVLRTNFKES